jgi:tetratricopeptide (TPR) repeat protein
MRIRLLLLLSCWLAVQPAMAGPGFISGSRVVKGSFLAEVTVQFNCGVQYVSHEPSHYGDQLRVHIESTGICNGVSPLVENVREMHRPANSDEANLVSVEYDGETNADSMLRFSFSEDVRYSVRPSGDDNSIVVRVFLEPAVVAAQPRASRETSKLVAQPDVVQPKFVINLESSRRPPAAADFPNIPARSGKEYFYSETLIDGATWHRLRLGYFDTAEKAARVLAEYRKTYPSAWVDRAIADDSDVQIAPAITTTAGAQLTTVEDAPTTGSADDKSKQAALMKDARRAMTAGEISRAVQIYTKVLQQSPNAYEEEAQELLGLARERNGQIAHAKAEYQRYLAIYPDSEGAVRVQQRLTALLTQSSTQTAIAGNAVGSGDAAPRKSSDWNVRTFFTQFYRRDVNQINDNDQVVSQSSLYSDINVDARRRGQRFDFSTRLTAGYRSEFLKDPTSSGNDIRLSYAYADLADSRSGLRGRIGRQSRSTGGVLGRFDGVNLGYQLSDRVRFDAVAGKPVFSTADGMEDARTFYGVSSNIGLFSEDLDVGVFYLQQEIDGITDRQVVGGEARYFSDNKSFWGMADYDLSFQELGSLFIQGSWRLPKLFTVTGLLDRRRSPFLSTGSALIGQFDVDFSDLVAMMTEEELRQLALDRAASTTTVTLGLSRPLTPKLQININASQATVDATPESGGVAATQKSTYVYFSTDLVASSLIAQGDVSIFGIRYSDSNTTEVWSANIDTRFPIGRAFRINPRLRVDLRQMKSDLSEELIFTPGIRLQYRWGKRLRLEFEAGRQYANRSLAEEDLSRESYFVNFGYQFFY